MQEEISKNLEPTKLSAPTSVIQELDFWIKREDLSFCGSHKHFGISEQLSALKEKGVTKAVLPTSGNAGITACILAPKYGIDVTVLMNEKSPVDKITAVKNVCDKLFLSERSARMANYISAKYNLTNLRASMDDNTIKGFKNLAFEIFEQFKASELAKNSQKDDKYVTNNSKFFFKEIYTFVTSGASLIGMYEGFKKLKRDGEIQSAPRLIAVKGDAGKHGIKKNPRQKYIDTILEETNGETIQITDMNIEEFTKNISDKEALNQFSKETISSFIAAKKSGANTNSLVLSTGKNWSKEYEKTIDIKSLPTLNTFKDCDELFN